LFIAIGRRWFGGQSWRYWEPR